MEKKSSKFWVFMQSLGRTFMLPVALLAAMGILLGVGSGLSGATTVEMIPFLGNTVIQTILGFMVSISLVAFNFLPLLFAIAIPLGMAKDNKEIAAFAGVVGFIAMHLGTNFYLNSSGLIESITTQTIMGIESIDTGVLGALASGVLVYKIHERFQYTELPDSFAFFGGTRFVPIITVLIMSLVGLVVPLVWPVFSKGIGMIGQGIQQAGSFGPFLFGFGERMLLPFGLHHVLVATIRFTEAGGSYVTQAGETVVGALNIFYAQFAEGAKFVTPEVTAFLSQGKMPTFIFGLSGAALAIYQTAKDENKGRVKGLLISAVIASAVGGITEPIEFLFLFVAPLLYLFHAIMTGLGFMVMSLLGVMIGNTDGNIIDFVVFGVLQGSWTKWYLVIPIGILWFGIYYAVFKTYILRKDVATPGREETDSIDTADLDEKLEDYSAVQMIKAIGGKDNIKTLENCVTRLRVSLKDAELVDVSLAKKAGAVDVIFIGDDIQVIVGPQVQVLKNKMSKVLKKHEEH